MTPDPFEWIDAHDAFLQRLACPERVTINALGCANDLVIIRGDSELRDVTIRSRLRADEPASTLTHAIEQAARRKRVTRERLNPSPRPRSNATPHHARP